MTSGGGSLSCELKRTRSKCERETLVPVDVEHVGHDQFFVLVGTLLLRVVNLTDRRDVLPIERTNLTYIATQCQTDVDRKTHV